MNTGLIFIWIYLAMIALSFVEAYAEGRNSWDKSKVGWKIKLPGGYTFSGYHVFLFFVTLPLLLTLPFVIYGWDRKLFGIILSAYLTGLALEDFFYFIVNPVVGFHEFWTDFTDYYHWLRFKGKKVLPSGYFVLIGLAVLSWYFLWR